jgi:3D (Asp-Asp-Asp) domain-containing protein
VTVHATSYSPCSSSGSHTADGTAVSSLKDWGHVAVPRPGRPHHLPFGTLIRLRHPLHGRRYFRAHDYIGAFSELDFFDRDCGRAKRFTPRAITYRVVRSGR